MSKNNYKDRLDEILQPIETKGDEFYVEHIAPSTPAYIRRLAEKAGRVEFVEFDADDREDQFDAIFIGREWVQDNTYNYNEPWTDSMCIVRAESQHEDAPCTIALAPHYGGDVRGNYGDFVVLHFKTFWDYIEVVHDFLYDQVYSFELDGRDLECYYTGGGEYYYLLEQGKDLNSDGFVPERWTEEDFLNSVREHIKEVEE